MTNILAVIPARSGSKGIPAKNMAKVGEFSLIAHAARFAVAHPAITHAVISTDDPAFAREAVAFGVDCPFLRPPHLATDNASSLDAWKHALTEAERHFRVTFDYSVLLEPTSPFREPADIDRALQQMLDDGNTSAVTVSRTPAHYTPEKTLRVDSANRLSFYLQDGNRFNLRQSIPAYYHRNGVAYIMTREKLLHTDVIIDDHCSAYIVDHPTVNIDDEFELAVANMLHQKLSQNQ